MYEEWMEYVNKYENKNYSDATIRKQMLDDFLELSKKYWENILSIYSIEELIEDISDIWFNVKSIENMSVEDAFEEAVGYIFYASDRMDLNRWFRIRCLLNKGIE